jgi:predicted dehydrogenase
MRRLRVAVIGTGFIGPVHAEAVRRNSDLAEVAAIVGSSDESAAESANSLGVPLHSGDFRAIIARDDIDLVHICTPNYLHYKMVKECLQQGKHVLCEKPLALTSAEARELVEIAGRTGLKAAVNYNLRYYPMIREMRCRNTEEEAGAVFAVQGVYLQDWLLNPTDYSWRLESSLSGKTRAIADIGTHWMDMAQHVTGLKITRVLAQFARMHAERKKQVDGRSHTFSHQATEESGNYMSYPVDTEDYAQMLFEFENGVLGNLTVSQVSAGYKNYMEYRQTGTGAAFAWDSESPNRLFIGRRDRANEILMKDAALLKPEAGELTSYPGGHQEGYGETMKYLFREFYLDILGRSQEAATPFYPTLIDGLGEMLLCEAILTSVGTGGWVEVTK